MTIIACTNCGRQANDLKRCTGSCGGQDFYCNRQCQKADWKMHKKICPRGEDSTVQSLTFTLPVAGIEEEVPLRAKRTLDAYAQSEVIICYSDHLGLVIPIISGRIDYSLLQSKYMDMTKTMKKFVMFSMPWLKVVIHSSMHVLHHE